MNDDSDGEALFYHLNNHLWLLFIEIMHIHVFVILYVNVHKSIGCCILSTFLVYVIYNWMILFIFFDYVGPIRIDVAENTASEG